MSFYLSTRSIQRMFGVHPQLVEVVNLAISYTEIDFGVIEGVRDISRQRKLVDEGSSWTMKSKHLMQETGYGHAIDLLAYFDRRASWEMKHYAKVAEAMRKAATFLNVTLTWGGVWDRTISELTLQDGFNNDITEYVKRFKKKHGRRPHLDGPHFQIEV